MTVAEAIRDAAGRLESISDTARLDAEVLMAHALGVSRSDLLIQHMHAPAPDAFEALVLRRAGYEPVAYITGVQEFYGLELEVAPGVLIPRGDSETLIEVAVERFANREPPASILDLGTGSGSLLLAAMSLFPDARGVGLDSSREVMAVFERNAARHGLKAQAQFALASWHEEGWADALGTFDLVLCNPPYVEDGAALDPQVRDYEPSSALFAGAEGLDDYRILIPQLRSLMNDNAVAILEIGATQGEQVSAIARSQGFEVEVRHDLANRPRCVVLC